MVGTTQTSVRVNQLADDDLSWWARSLRAQLRTAAGPEQVDEARMAAFVHDGIVADGGTMDTRAVHEAGLPVAACRVSECLHPLTLRRDLRVEGLCAAPAGAAALLDALPHDLEVRVELPLLGTARALQPTLRQLGFRPEVLLVRRPTDGLRPAPDWQIRAATAQDTDFLYDCLAAAVRNGLNGTSAQVDIDDWIRTRYARLLRPGVTCVIAELDGRPVGHGYVTAGPDRYGRGPCGFLHDVFVLPAAKGLGCAHALTGALGERLSAGGVPVLEGEVIMTGGDKTALRGGLHAAGWREDRMRWLRPAQ